MYFGGVNLQGLWDVEILVHTSTRQTTVGIAHLWAPDPALTWTQMAAAGCSKCGTLNLQWLVWPIHSQNKNKTWLEIPVVDK